MYRGMVASSACPQSIAAAELAQEKHHENRGHVLGIDHLDVEFANDMSEAET